MCLMTASPLDEAAATESVSRAIEDPEVLLLQLQDGVLRQSVCTGIAAGTAPVLLLCGRAVRL